MEKHINLVFLTPAENKPNGELSAAIEKRLSRMIVDELILQNPYRRTDDNKVVIGYALSPSLAAYEMKEAIINASPNATHRLMSISINAGATEDTVDITSISSQLAALEPLCDVIVAIVHEHVFMAFARENALRPPAKLDPCSYFSISLFRDSLVNCYGSWLDGSNL